MGRGFAASDLVALPVLNAAEAFALSQSLLSTADGVKGSRPHKKLPLSIARALKGLGQRHEALRPLLQPAPPPSHKDARAADRDEDHAVVAVRS
jgi:hypothetical protein